MGNIFHAPGINVTNEHTYQMVFAQRCQAEDYKNDKGCLILSFTHFQKEDKHVIEIWQNNAYDIHRMFHELHITSDFPLALAHPQENGPYVAAVPSPLSSSQSATGSQP